MMKKLMWSMDSRHPWSGSFYLNTLLFSEDKRELLIGDASHGHFR